jgi:hypothetical protein
MACTIDPKRDGDCWDPKCRTHGRCATCGLAPGRIIHEEPHGQAFWGPSDMGARGETHAFVAQKAIDGSAYRT